VQVLSDIDLDTLVLGAQAVVIVLLVVILLVMTRPHRKD
jgi:hypothetical protein